MGNFPNHEGLRLFGVLDGSNQIHKMFRSKAFSARPVYFLSIVKNGPEIAMDLCHGKKDVYFLENPIDE